MDYSVHCTVYKKYYRVSYSMVYNYFKYWFPTSSIMVKLGSGVVVAQHWICRGFFKSHLFLQVWLNSFGSRVWSCLVYLAALPLPPSLDGDRRLVRGATVGWPHLHIEGCWTQVYHGQVSLHIVVLCSERRFQVLALSKERLVLVKICWCILWTVYRGPP